MFFNHLKKYKSEAEDSSVNKSFALQAEGPEFDPQNPHFKIVGHGACACDPSISPDRKISWAQWPASPA